MNTREYVDKLFEGYGDTQELRDFKLEIAANLDDRITDLKKKGSSEPDAFSKAVSELGNITEIADDISRQKRNEVINRMYVHQQVKVSAKHAIGYVFAGALFLFGVIVALMTSGNFGGSSSMFAALPFVTVSVPLFVFLGLTQETAVNYPMNKRRALWYALASGMGTFGVVTTIGMYFSREYMDFSDYTMTSLAVLIPFGIPAAGWLAFLLLTEKKRHKPWVTDQANAYAAQFEGRNAEKFGILSGILWVASIALFITLGVIFGFAYSWLVFLFSVVGEMILLYFMMFRK